MKCGICEKNHAGTFYKTKDFGFVSIDCLIRLMNEAIKIKK
jgi:hypothetical protein